MDWLKVATSRGGVKSRERPVNQINSTTLQHVHGLGQCEATCEGPRDGSRRETICVYQSRGTSVSRVVGAWKQQCDSRGWRRGSRVVGGAGPGASHEGGSAAADKALTAQLEQAIDEMMTLINSPSQAPSTSMQHAAQRHRDNLEDYRRDFLRTRVGRCAFATLTLRTTLEWPCNGSICSDRCAKISSECIYSEHADPQRIPVDAGIANRCALGG